VCGVDAVEAEDDDFLLSETGGSERERSGTQFSEQHAAA
jgi:hypothetical protein